MKECAAGNFTDGPGAKICKPCSAGSYCPTSGTSSVSIKQCEVSNCLSRVTCICHVNWVMFAGQFFVTVWIF